MTKDTLDAQLLNAASEAVLFLTGVMRGQYDDLDADPMNRRYNAALTILDISGLDDTPLKELPEIVVEYTPE